MQSLMARDQNSWCPNHGRDDAGYDSEEEERDLHHQDMYMNGGRNHHFGPPPTQEG